MPRTAHPVAPTRTLSPSPRFGSSPPLQQAMQHRMQQSEPRMSTRPRSLPLKTAV